MIATFLWKKITEDLAISDSRSSVHKADYQCGNEKYSRKTWLSVIAKFSVIFDDFCVGNQPYGRPAITDSQVFREKIDFCGRL